MATAQNKILKNTTCVCLGLFFVSLSALLMVQLYYRDTISAQIQNVSALKDIKYPLWGTNPNPSGSQYLQHFTLYTLDQQDGRVHSTKSNITKSYHYIYKYSNTSFTQGSSGRLNFINEWSLDQVTDNAPRDATISSLNLAADRVYNYDYYAPPQRKFVILYNYLKNILANEFLEKFYAAYLHRFFFHDKQLVQETVFKPMGIDQERGELIYSHRELGWSTVDGFSFWVRLALKGYAYASQTPEYESIITKLKLSPKEVSSLLFAKSTVHNMMVALNATIKGKASLAKSLGYNCEGEYCSNDELVGFQISEAFLTKDPLFTSLGLNMTTKEFNSTIFADIEYSTFCKNHPELECIPENFYGQFFSSHHFQSFQKMNGLWLNQNNSKFIVDTFNLGQQNPESIFPYVMHLYDQFIQKFEPTFAWTQTNYNNLQSAITSYRNLLLVELYSRGFVSKFIQKKVAKCEDYFTGDFAKYQQAVCSSQEWNFIKSDTIRTYMKAYFFIDNMRTKMVQTLGMSYQQAITFFNDQSKSLLAQQIRQLEAIYQTSFGCSRESNQICSHEQLFCMQWGSGSILSNLPADIFENKVQDISQWDSQGVLNGFNPDYSAVVGQTKTLDQCESMLSSNGKEGVLSFLNLLNLGIRADESAKKMLMYIGKSVMEVNFKGLINAYSVDDLFKGFKSDIIQYKKGMAVTEGGAPWLTNQVKLVKTDNKAQIKNNELSEIPQFDTINTGIYNQDKTRQITKIWGEDTSSSQYQVYKGTKKDDQGQETNINIFSKYVTDRKVAGTNILGFHPDIEQGENLQIYLPQAYQAMTLMYKGQQTYKQNQNSADLSAYRYTISGNTESFVGVEELNQNHVTLSPESYVIVEPTTGLTLEFKISYTVKSKSLITSNIVDRQQPITLYESQIQYQRRNLVDIELVNSDISMQGILKIVALVAIGVSFLSALGAGFMYLRTRKNTDEVSDALLAKQTAY